MKGTAGRRLAVLFAAIYFVQGIAEPTEGLIAQPVRSLLKSWGHTPGEIASFMSWLALPWMIKPLYGLIVDFLPLGRSSRRNYLRLTTGLTSIGLLWLHLATPPAGESWLFWGLLLVPTIGVAFSDVVSDSLMVTYGQPLGMTGRLQSIQWTAMYAATLAAGIVGGWLSHHGKQTLGFLICGVAAGLSFLIALFFVPDGANSSSQDRVVASQIPALRPLREVWRDLEHGQGRSLAAATLFLFLWNFNPFSSSVLYSYMTGPLGLGEAFYGTTVSILSLAAMIACIAYGSYCNRIPLRGLLHVAIAMGIVATLAYRGLAGPQSAIWITAFVGFTYMTGSLIQMDLAARVCPREISGVVFAALMSVANGSLVLSTYLGGLWYDRWSQTAGAAVAFDRLVLVGTAFNAACWILVPWLAATAPVASATTPTETDREPSSGE